MLDISQNYPSCCSLLVSCSARIGVRPLDDIERQDHTDTVVVVATEVMAPQVEQGQVSARLVGERLVGEHRESVLLALVPLGLAMFMPDRRRMRGAPTITSITTFGMTLTFTSSPTTARLFTSKPRLSTVNPRSPCVLTYIRCLPVSPSGQSVAQNSTTTRAVPVSIISGTTSTGVPFTFWQSSPTANQRSHPSRID